uniref:CSON008919 protein n=1 Tax=Culicoides sonorensis TaxID=179676 RepID=A0A336MBF7_CULSO
MNEFSGSPGTAYLSNNIGGGYPEPKYNNQEITKQNNQQLIGYDNSRKSNNNVRQQRVQENHTHSNNNLNYVQQFVTSGDKYYENSNETSLLSASSASTTVSVSREYLRNEQSQQMNSVNGIGSNNNIINNNSSSSNNNNYSQHQQSSVTGGVNTQYNNNQNYMNSSGVTSASGGVVGLGVANGNMVAATGNQHNLEGMGYNNQMNNGMGGMHQGNMMANGMQNGGGGWATNAQMGQMNQMGTAAGMNGMNQMQMGGGMGYGGGAGTRHHPQMNPMQQMQQMGMSGGGMQQQQMNPGMNPGMGPMNGMNQLGPMAKMQGMANGYSRNRVAPYPNPQLAAAQKRAGMYGGAAAGMGMASQGGMPFGQNQNVPIGMQGSYGRSTSAGPMYGGRGPGQMMPTQRQNSMPPYGTNGPMNPQYYGNATAAGGYQNMQGFQNMQPDPARMNYQHSPVPGNPTPPLTPASSMTPYISPNPDIKPNIIQKPEELRLTFPVRDGIILPPFRLEHNLAVSNHVFQLKPTVYNTLMCRSDLELQLKCFHHEDRQMNTNWPASVQVSANSNPLEIDRGENKNSHRPLYLKQVCQPGRNTIQITVSTCCCSHLFVLQLVHRPSVRHVLHTLLRRNLLPAEHSVAKIKRFFASGGMPPNAMQQLGNESDPIQDQQSVRVFLKCGITGKRIMLPARGHDCKHIQCFDLETYLQVNCERGNWRCPVCNKPALTEGLEIDQYMWAILNTIKSSGNETDEVMIDAQANWKSLKPFNPNNNNGNNTTGTGANNTIKQENDLDSKQFNKVMSPGSTSLPSWDNLQAMSPYMSPDMNSIASGSMMGQNFNNQRPQFDNFGNPIKQDSNQGTPNSTGEYGVNPLAHLNDSVNSLDPLNAMEKSLNDQMPHTPHTPHTPGGGHPMTPGGPPSVPPASDINNQSGTNQNPNSNSNSSPQHNNTNNSNNTSNNNNNSTNSNNMLNSSNPAANIMNSPQSLMNSPQNMMNSPMNSNNGNQNISNNVNMQQNLMNTLGSLTDVDLNADLNFDPAAVIDGEGGNDLNLLPESVVDPTELLSFLDPPDLNTPPSSGSSNNPNNDDILAALFD